jgi:peptidoglycan-associated lipoprotein
MQGASAGSGESGSSSSLELMRRGELASSSGPLKEVYYEFDQHTLHLEAREILKSNANWLKANPVVRVEIEGHADERGTNEYNLALGSKRAESCKDYLVSLGISEERVSTVSYGEEVPACRDQSDTCWQKNRRARFVIVPMGRAS